MWCNALYSIFDINIIRHLLSHRLFNICDFSEYALVVASYNFCHFFLITSLCFFVDFFSRQRSPRQAGAPTFSIRFRFAAWKEVVRFSSLESASIPHEKRTACAISAHNILRVREMVPRMNRGDNACLVLGVHGVCAAITHLAKNVKFPRG